MTSRLAARRKHETNEECILAELRRLLRQKQFSGAPQLSAFLRYIVTEALEGRAHAIKAYSVGVDALGKPDTFDAQNDPSVRVLALRLRKALAVIYSSDQIPCAVIELKVGSYVPEFFSVVENASEKPTSDTNSKRALSASAPDLPGQTGKVNPETTPDATSYASRTVDAVNRVNAQSDSVTRQLNVMPRNPVRGFIFMFIVATLVLALFVLERSNAARTANWMGSDRESIPVAYAAVQGISPDANAAMDATDSLPSVLLMNQNLPSRRVGGVTVLLSAALLQDGQLQLIRPQAGSELRQSVDTDYTLLLDEYSVDGDLRVEVQLLTGDTGAILHSSSMSFDQSATRFSNREVQQLEQFAGLLTSPAGPIFADYCRNETHNTMGTCGHNGVVDNRLAKYLPVGEL